jgi:signal transduction histidine kinase
VHINFDIKFKTPALLLSLSILMKIQFVVLILLSQVVNGATKADDLLTRYQTQNGTEKILTGFEICDSLVSNPSEMLLFAKELQHAAELIVPGSLLHAKALRALADAYYYAELIDSSGIFLQQAIIVYDKSGQPDTLFIGNAYNDLGYHFQIEGKRNESRQFLQKAIAILSGSKHAGSLGDPLSNLAFLNHSEGKFEEAIGLFKQVYEIDLATGNTNDQSNSLNSLGRMYIDWGKFETGIQYYRRSVELLDTVHDIQTLAIRYNNIGMAYQLMEYHREAILWIERARNIEEQSGNKNRLAIRYFNLANSYLALTDYKKAEDFFLLANEIITQTGSHSLLAKLNTAMGHMYFLQGRNGKAIDHYLMAEQHAELNNALPERSMIYNRLFTYYRKTGQFDKALKYYEKHINAKDSIFSIDAAKQIEELEIQYETAQKELEITRLVTENELNKSEARFRKRERNIAAIGFVILSSMLAVLYKLFRTLKKQKSLLSAQNSELERLNTIQNSLFSIISHDFRSITSSYQTSARIIEHYLNKGQPEKLLPIANEISRNSKNLSSMLENLLQWAIAQRKGIESEKRVMSVKEELVHAVEVIGDQIKSKNNTVDIVSQDETVFCDPESFKLVIRNILANANKFTTSGLISINVENSGIETTIRISDTGTGMTDETRNNLFKINRTKLRSGTAGERGTGLGLLLVAEHLEKNSGNIDVSSEPGMGATFIIKLPSLEI